MNIYIVYSFPWSPDGPCFQIHGAYSTKAAAERLHKGLQNRWQATYLKEVYVSTLEENPLVIIED